MELTEKIFSIRSEEEFRRLSLETFHRQYLANQVYHDYVDARKVKVDGVQQIDQIPFLPIEFFKTHDVVCGNQPPQRIFRSSGTTSETRSNHIVNNLSLYRHSLINSFKYFFGLPDGYQFAALTPTPEQNPTSSLVFMIQYLMDSSQSAESGYFLGSFTGLHARLKQARSGPRKIFLIGLTYALVDFAEQYPGSYAPLIVMETGGMKGRRREMTREELHGILCPAFGVETIHSEYGMTELLSQAYSKGEGLFATPPWMRVMIRDASDPLSYMETGKTGGINIIDLANVNSCSFIATQDLGRVHADGRFEVLGRFDNSDIRGCSLMQE